MNFKDKVILVTGAADGIGKGIAIRFAECDGFVIVTDINREKGEELVNSLKDANKKADFIYMNVSDIEKNEKIVSEMINKYKKVDILVNNAGICPIKSYKEITLSEWDKVIRINLTSVFFIIKEISKYMEQMGYGKIVNISSLGAKIGGINVGPHYVSSKGGIDALTRYFAKNLAKYNINVNAVSMSTTDTSLIKDWDKKIIEGIIKNTPLNRIACVDDVANIVLFLSSDKSSFITGEVVNVNGGLYMD